ncbi:transketolase [Allofustis seminis]|uniref:transketolase n=1 Tax=Allofustis seminis TaxID=166939 RepID=UPI00036E163E|nr:transketolase [Allofustis seminis]
MFDQVDTLSVNTMRMLSIQMIQEANSGHPGLPLGASPMAYALWKDHLCIYPKQSKWFNRDRFILSAGHGSAMLYSLLHLAGFEVSIDDLKDFRQLHSKTPGHPEVGHTDGVEATTGPLGQGFANAVGMAMAEAHLAAVYNKPSYPIIDHYTYSLAGDGCLQEGVTQEAASLAGHLKLGKLIVLYDSNDIQLDGPTNLAFSESVKDRFKAYGWDYHLVEDGNDLQAISEAIEAGKKVTDQPTLIEIKTQIGYGSPVAGSNAAHGAPLGSEGVDAVAKALQWNYKPFEVPTEVADRFHDALVEKGKKAYEKWEELFAAYKHEYPKLGQQLEEAIAGHLPKNWQENLPIYKAGENLATRNVSGEVINAIANTLPNLWGGSADLSGSNKTMINGAEDFQFNHYDGRNIWYGVREFAMAAAMNGIVLHGGTITYAATFFVFSDYLRPAIRLAALSKLPSIFVLTHDSVAVGEDGPTHEPVEHLSSYRGMPNVNVIRPADSNEVSAAWKLAIESKSTPTLLVLTRQNVPTLEHTDTLAFDGVEKGAYVVSPAEKETPDGILIATGSEVHLAVQAQKLLGEKGLSVSVVSMPAMERFDKQSAQYKESVLPQGVTKRVAIEMGSSFGWDRYVGSEGRIIAIDRFGESGNGDQVIEYFGFTAENIVQQFLDLNA